ncbi:MAG: carboxynorspermidine decarboxylase [Planctomycetota bacterium]|jgi:carboxynorspermidine decarboxylase
MWTDDPVIPSPCFVLEEERLAHNLSILDRVQRESGAKILLALKGFAMHAVFPQIRAVLAGTTASSLNEALLGQREFGKELHTCCVAYRDDEIDRLAALSDHLVFNSFSQWVRFRETAALADTSPSCGIRINPEVGDADVDIYNPCGRHSRLGVTRDQFRPDLLDDLAGLHFHALCEKNSDSLEQVLTGVEERFGEWLGRMEWVNFGGGHHITRDDYDLGLLTSLVKGFRERYGVEVYLEPGEAVALNAGVLIATVLDIVENEGLTAILDTSASTHMPDVLEMPYRPEIRGAGEPGEKAHTYRLGGATCLAGDRIGEYSFDAPLQLGDRLVFHDMAHYSMVKTTTFNGINLPAIGIRQLDGSFRLIKSFGYEDYRGRLS